MQGSFWLTSWTLEGKRGGEGGDNKKDFLLDESDQTHVHMYRIRPGVLQPINFIFRHMMSKALP